MTADRLSVDLDGLISFAARLEAVRTRLNATATVAGYDGSLGSGDVAHALDGFEANWSDGRAAIDGQLAGLAKMANGAVDSIRKADADLADKLTEHSNAAQTNTVHSPASGPR